MADMHKLVLNNKAMLKKLIVSNLLSFKENTEIPFGNLNVIIGPNGSGKSNIFDCLEVVAGLVQDESVGEYIKKTGGLGEWIYSGPGITDKKGIETLINGKDGTEIRHTFNFKWYATEVSIDTEEVLLNLRTEGNVVYEKRFLEDVGKMYGTFTDPSFIAPYNNKSIVSQGNIRSQYIHEAINELYNNYLLMVIYTNISFGRGKDNFLRREQKHIAGRPLVLPDMSNMFAVLLNITSTVAGKEKLLSFLKELDYKIEDLDANYSGELLIPYVQTHGNRKNISLARLSDGTLRFLALLAMLIGNTQQNGIMRQATICIEEPELGLNPKAIKVLAEVIKYAAKDLGHEVIISTHSSLLLYYLTDAVDYALSISNTEGYSEVKVMDRANIDSFQEIYEDLGNMMDSNVI